MTNSIRSFQRRIGFRHARAGSLPLLICAIVAAGLVLAACEDDESTPSPQSAFGAQTIPLAAVKAPTPAPALVPERTPTLSPGAVDAAQQRAIFLIQEQLRVVEAERAAEIRRQRAARERREQILNEIARRAARIRDSIEAERHRREAQDEIIGAACEQAQLEEIAADYRGELPSHLTRQVLSACDQTSAADRWEQIVAVLPDARAEWDAFSEGQKETWAEAERLEAEFRLAEEVRQRQAEIEAQILTDQTATARSPQVQSSDPGWFERVQAALPAPLIQLVRQSVAQFGDLAAELSQRAAYVNQRARSGAVTGLALAEKIPPGVRAAGEDAMNDFISARDVSHIESVRNNPSRAADPDNLIWEKSKWNRARGARNISAAALIRANAQNAGAALTVAGPGILAQTAQGCVIGAVMELPVAAAEQRVPVQEGLKTTEEAVLDTAKSVAATGLAGCAITAAAAVAVSAGFVSLGAPVLIPIALAGGSVYVLTTSTRIWNSLSEEEKAAVLGQLDVTRGVVSDLAESTWAAAQDGGTVVAGAIQAAADEAGWWDESGSAGQESPDEA